MRAFGEVWVVFLLIMLFTSSVSALVWGTYGHPGYGRESANPEAKRYMLSLDNSIISAPDLNISYRFYADSNIVGKTYESKAMGLRITKYFDRERELIRSEYDTDDDGSIDMAEYVWGGSRVIESDINASGGILQPFMMPPMMAA